MSLWLVLAALLVPLVLVGVVLLLISRPRRTPPPAVPTLAPSSAFLAPTPTADPAHLVADPAHLVADPAHLGAPPAPRPPLTVVLDTGTALPLTGPIVIGRDPLAPPSHPSAAPVPLADTAKSISKTHLLVAPAHSGVLVMDLHSINGVAVRLPDGDEATLTAGDPMVVPAASTVTFGERSLEVR